MRLLARLLIAAAVPFVATSALAQSVAAPGDDVVVTVGGGLRTDPEWDGAKHYVLTPFPIVGLKFLRSPFTGEPTSDTGFGIAPSFRLYSKRHFDPGSPLFGLSDVATAFEAGVTVDYTDTNFRVFASARQGMGGQHGQTFDLGLDGILRPLPQLKLEAGPRVSFATANYMRAYFGVTDAEAAATGIASYKPGGGLRAAGLEAVATWDIDKNWFVRGDAAWNRMTSIATDSPVMKAAGNRDQFTVGLGVAYRFGTGWH